MAYLVMESNWQEWGQIGEHKGKGKLESRIIENYQ